MSSTDFLLRERVKELNCLYELSKVAWEKTNDLKAIVGKTLEILPDAMQFPPLAEARINIQGDVYVTAGFARSKYMIESPLTIDRKHYGSLTVGYRSGTGKLKPAFLKEERSLLHAVARELSLFIKRASIEEEKNKLQIQLQHVERLAFVGELSAGIAHELNEPLGRILGFAQLIKKGGQLSDQQSEDIERIIKASLYTREIIKKLMIFSRQMPQQITKVNLNTVTSSILYFIDVRFQSRGIEIVKQLGEKLPDIQADEVQISQVLVNLITNAVHAMPEGGVITVSTKAKGSQVILTVKDTGTGMPPEIRQKIFEPFFTTKPVGQGTGLGLSVVKGIVDTHDGEIKVKSAIGRGTTFEVRLPVARKNKNEKKSIR